MAYCGPACAVPNIASTPKIGFGSGGALSYAGLGAALRRIGCGRLRTAGVRLGAGALVETSGSLGTLAGVRPSCINQTPPSELTISPSPVVLTLPGAILSASCVPVAVGGNTPCAVGKPFGGFGALGYANPVLLDSFPSVGSGPATLGINSPSLLNQGIEFGLIRIN